MRVVDPGQSALTITLVPLEFPPYTDCEVYELGVEGGWGNGEGFQADWVNLACPRYNPISLHLKSVCTSPS